MLSRLDLIELAKKGASITLNAAIYSRLDLIDIAKAVKDGKTLQINNANASNKLTLAEVIKANPKIVVIISA